MTRRHGAGSSLAHRAAVACFAITLSVGALAGEAPASHASDNGFVAWVRSVGRAIGMAFRDLGSEGKKVGLAVGHGAADVGKKIGHGAADAGKGIGHGAANAGKEVGHGAAKVGKAIGHGAADAGKEIGQAAKQGAKSLRNALTGKDSSN